MVIFHRLGILFLAVLLAATATGPPSHAGVPVPPKERWRFPDLRGYPFWQRVGSLEEAERVVRLELALPDTELANEDNLVALWVSKPGTGRVVAMHFASEVAVQIEYEHRQTSRHIQSFIHGVLASNDSAHAVDVNGRPGVAWDPGRNGRRAWDRFHPGIVHFFKGNLSIVTGGTYLWNDLMPVAETLEPGTSGQPWARE